MRLLNILIITVIGLLPVCPQTTYAMSTPQSAAAARQGDVTVEMNTTMGAVRLLLYGDTPRHLKNFVKLVNEGYYNGVLFHRVIRDFMVQTGDPDSRNAAPGQRLGMGSPDYKIDAEIVWPARFHRRGALAAAREGDQVNPEKRSSGSQFYVVTGRKFSEGQLRQMERQMSMAYKQEVFNRLASEHRDSIMAMRRNRDQAGLQALQEELAAKTEQITGPDPVKFTPEQIEAYTTVGGAPHLDRNYTVFGEVISGMDVIDRIEQVETDSADRPKEDVRVIDMKIVSD